MISRREDLPNAIALNSTLVNGAVGGTFGGGILIRWPGRAGAF